MSIQREALEAIFRRHFPRTKMSRAFVAFGEDVAALSAPTEQVPAGWKSVPLESTPEMHSACRAARVSNLGADEGKHSASIWSAMLAASPVAPKTLDALTEGEALQAAEAARIKKIASLRKQLAKLERMNFTTPGAPDGN